MTVLPKSILPLFFVLAGFISYSQASQKNLDIHSNAFNRGQYCYILWTTDSAKCSIKEAILLRFDSNNVVYVHRNYFQKPGDSIRIFDENGRNISQHMINIMGDVENSYLFFYNPTDEEITAHPYFDDYYHNKLFFGKKDFRQLSKLDLKKLGYTLENKN